MSLVNDQLPAHSAASVRSTTKLATLLVVALLVKIIHGAERPEYWFRWRWANILFSRWCRTNEIALRRCRSVGSDIVVTVSCASEHGHSYEHCGRNGYSLQDSSKGRDRLRAVLSWQVDRTVLYGPESKSRIGMA